MSTKKRGMVTVSGERAKHLRWFLRRRFWKNERRAARREALMQAKAVQQEQHA